MHTTGVFGERSILDCVHTRAVHRTFFGPSTSSDSNILSSIQPLMSEILWTALKQFLETDLVQEPPQLGAKLDQP